MRHCGGHHQQLEKRTPNYALLETPLSSLIHGKHLQTHDTITGMPEAATAFMKVKLAVQLTTILGILDPMRNVPICANGWSEKGMYYIRVSATS